MLKFEDHCSGPSLTCPTPFVATPGDPGAGAKDYVLAFLLSTSDKNLGLRETQIPAALP